MSVANSYHHKSGQSRTSQKLPQKLPKNPLYAIHFQKKQVTADKLNELTKMLLDQYEEKAPAWRAKVEEEMLGAIYLRLMMSVKNMSGGRWGDYGRLNYL